MIFLLLWPLAGALIGYSAALNKGWNPVAGFIGGMVLGIFSPFMFFVSGVATSNEQKKCRFCAEWVKSEAVVCKHCGRDLAVEDPKKEDHAAPPEVIKAERPAGAVRREKETEPENQALNIIGIVIFVVAAIGVLAYIVNHLE